MKNLLKILACLLPLVAVNSWAAESTPSQYSCTDFQVTEDALRRFPDLKGACESVVERDGELYGLFRAVVRRASAGSVTLYLPATDHTFKVDPQPDARVLVGGRKVRPRDLNRGDEVRIYLSVSAFTKPQVEVIALVTETEEIVQQPVEAAPALPTTASPWPAIALGSLLLLGFGHFLRRRRLS